MVDWDARWAENAAERFGGVRLYGAEPNRYLAQRLSAAPPPHAGATALCLADGDGRNGAWLASLGYAVTAVDVSAVATEQARAHDALMGVQVDRVVGDIAVWTPPEGVGFDLVALIYCHCPSPALMAGFRTACERLRPGGLLILEGFSTAQLGGAMGPKNSDLLYDIEVLAAEAERAGLALEEALEGRVRLDEGRKHVGEGRVARLTALRPG